MVEGGLLEPVDGEAILANVRAIGPELVAAGEAIDAARQLPDEVFDLIRRTGAYRMAFPRMWGGPEVDPVTQIRIVAELAAANGSAGWCAMIGSDGGYFAAAMDQTVAREMWSDMDIPTAVTAYPPGRAEEVEGGFRVTGRWPYASGCLQSRWIGGHCAVFTNGEPKLMASGQLEMVLPFVARAEAEIFDTWNTTGLRGSGSHDWAVSEYFVPAERTGPGIGVRRPQLPGPLYDFPFWFLANQSGVPLGLAKGAIETALSILRTKQTINATGAASQPHVQGALGEAMARFAAAEAYVLATVSALWKAVGEGARVGRREMTGYRLCNAHAHKECLAVVDAMYELCGGAALYLPNPMDRYMRDMRTANQHAVASRATYFEAGKAMLEIV